ncbi:MAG: tetraacyldisaccharide 4'-kinase [Pyrinomonadaceae bacterium]
MKSIILMPFSQLYGAAIRARLKLYEKGFFKSRDLGAPTVSVGNITVGGTGKTPLVARIAEILAERGAKVCILTRGYRRENERDRILVSDGEKILADVEKAGDEPLELAEKLLGKTVLIADANRARAGRWARAKFGITTFILDDAFQHLKVRRDLDIVCIDATNPFGNGKLLPQGILREPLKNLKRADAVVITRANLAANVSDLKTRIFDLNPNGKIFVSKNKLNPESGIWNLKSIAAFCALGNPENFFAQLRQEGFDLVFTKTFPDHHFYAQKDIDALEREARAKGAQCFITTAKDAVKLKNLNFKIPFLAAKSELFFDDETAFREMILKMGRRK